MGLGQKLKNALNMGGGDEVDKIDTRAKGVSSTPSSGANALTRSGHNNLAHAGFALVYNYGFPVLYLLHNSKAFPYTIPCSMLVKVNVFKVYREFACRCED